MGGASGMVGSCCVIWALQMLVDLILVDLYWCSYLFFLNWSSFLLKEQKRGRGDIFEGSEVLWVIELRNKHNRMLLAEDSSAIKKLTSFQNLYVELSGFQME
jgi:hypothetical protein